MNNPFKKVIEQYFYFSKSDRNAILFLAVFILIIVIGLVVVDNVNQKSKYNHTQYRQLLEELEAPKSNFRKVEKSLFEFDPNTISSETLDSLDLPEFVKRNMLNYRNAGGKFSSPLDVRKIYGMNDSIFLEIENYISLSDSKNKELKAKNKEPQFNGFFDPNTADISRLSEFGFNRFQANNIIQYRLKGGKFKSKSDLLKIYGIDSAVFKAVEKHISIEVSNEIELISSSMVIPHIELNSADTTELMKLKGVGAVYANRIIKYRNLLGGFYSTSQLIEVYNFPIETLNNIESTISVDTLLIKKINLNFAEYADLLRHPYLNKTQVAAILNYRDKNGSFQNTLQLETSGLVDSETFHKVKPYLTCR